jgi:hypothetical protein
VLIAQLYNEDERRELWRRNEAGLQHRQQLLSDLDLSAARVLQLGGVPLPPQEGVLWLERQEATAEWGQLCPELVVLISPGQVRDAHVLWPWSIKPGIVPNFWAAVAYYGTPGHTSTLIETAAMSPLRSQYKASGMAAYGGSEPAQTRVGGVVSQARWMGLRCGVSRCVPAQMGILYMQDMQIVQ